MMSDQQSQRLTALEVHNTYHERGQQVLHSRLQSLEAQTAHLATTPTTIADMAARLQRLEDQARLLRVVAGLLMLALASSGVMGGTASKVGKLLLGVI